MMERRLKSLYDDGMEQAARHILLLLGRKRFGEPPPGAILTLRKIEDMDRFDRMALRLLEVSSWAELLDTP